MKRSKYLGVYHNFDNPYPYRVALKRYVNGKPEYTNHGYFHHERAAAFVFDIHAITTFGAGAVINGVTINDEEQIEVERHKNETPGFMELALGSLEMLSRLADAGVEHVRQNPKIAKE